MRILLTGGAGYIGSHVVKHLISLGHSVLVVDNFSTGHRFFLERLKVPFVEADIGDREFIRVLLKKHTFDVAMHFSAWISVAESVQHPLRYYENNVSKTLCLVQELLQANVQRFVFSSTAAVYGIPQSSPIVEEHPLNPINPYGRSKLFVEEILQDLAKTSRFQYVIFRYFNAAGADPQGQLGELHNPETHLIPLVLQHLAGKRESISVFGTDYPTPDGTCIRDYIHVQDLAEAHALGAQYLWEQKKSNIFNLGNGQGFSVREIIQAAEATTGKKALVRQEARRPGDPAVLVASAEKARSTLKWQPRWESLTHILETAWTWEQGLK